MPSDSYANMCSMGGSATSTAQLTLDGADRLHELLSARRAPVGVAEAATCLFKWTKPLHDPNGLGYAHAGYTGTMLAHLPHYSDAKRARVGALAVFGPGTGVHVAVCLEPDPKHGDPELFSHGAEQAAGPIRLQVLAASLPGPVTWLNVSGL